MMLAVSSSSESGNGTRMHLGVPTLKVGPALIHKRADLTFDKTERVLSLSPK